MEFMILNHFYVSAIAISIAFISYLLMKKILKQPRNPPPSPPSRPLIGHLHLLKDPLKQTFQSLSAAYGSDMLLLRLGVRKALVVSSPAVAEECFTKNDIIFANRPQSLSAKHFSYNYTTVSLAPYGDHWRNLRRLAALEIFSPARIAVFTATRKRELMLMVNELMQKCVADHNGGSTRVDLKSKFIELSFNLLSMTIAGKRYYGENVEDEEEARRARFLIREMLENSGRSNLGDYLPFLRLIDYKGLEKKFRSLMGKLDKFMQDLVNERRRVLSAAGGREEAEQTMVDHLLSLQRKEPGYYTDEIIKGIIMVLLVAGTDTLSISLEWGMALLLNHPEAIKKIKAEIDSHVPENRLLEEQDLPNMTYLHNVIKETLRLYPPVPFLIPHSASEDCTLGGYDIEKGTMLLVNLWAIHRDPKLWEDPTEFKPERFEGRREAVEGSFMWLPFGAGRRGCPGAGLGTRVVGLALGTLIQAFEWERVGDELVDMSEGRGFSIPKVVPLEAICRPRKATMQYSLVDL